MKYQTGAVIDKNIAHYMASREQERLLSQLSLKPGVSYCIKFTEEPLTDYPEVLTAVLDKYQREDGQHVFCGDFTAREKIQEIILDRFYMLMLTCTEMEKDIQRVHEFEIETKSGGASCDSVVARS